MPLPIVHATAGISVWIALKETGRSWPSIRDLSLLSSCIILAVLPDFDFVVGFLYGNPNKFHHGASHSLFVCMAMGGMVSYLLSLKMADLPNIRILTCCLLSSLSHPLLDCLSADYSFPFGVELFWPFSEEYFVSAFPLFRDVSRDGITVGPFFKSLLTLNNFWGVVIEILFSGALLFLIMAFKYRFRRIRYTLSFLFCLLLYYGFQIEPNWIKVKYHDLSSLYLEERLKIAHLSDLHLSRITYRENKVMKNLEAIKPDITVFSGDVFDPFGEKNKLLLSPKLIPLIQYVSKLSGEKMLVWGEGICNNRHLLGRALSERGVHVLEDEEIISSSRSAISVTGCLPGLARFDVETIGENRVLSAGSSEINSFLHYNGGSSSWFDYDFSGRFQYTDCDSGFGLTFYSHYSSTEDRFYRVRLKNRKMEFSCHGTGTIKGITESNTIILPGFWYNFLISCVTLVDRTEFRVKFWRASDDEPEAWDLYGYDDTNLRLPSGTVGIWTNGDSGSKVFDDFGVENKSNGRVLLEEDFESSGLSSNWDTEKKITDSCMPLKKANYSVLLTHSFKKLYKLNVRKYDLILTGDTHGGQVCWPNGEPVKQLDQPFGWYSGLHKYKDMLVNISRGIGTSRIPFRLFCRPQVDVFKINYE